MSRQIDRSFANIALAGQAPRPILAGRETGEHRYAPVLACTGAYRLCLLISDLGPVRVPDRVGLEDHDAPPGVCRRRVCRGRRERAANGADGGGLSASRQEDLVRMWVGGDRTGPRSPIDRR